MDRRWTVGLSATRAPDGPPRIRVPAVGGKEFDEALGGPFTCGRDHYLPQARPKRRKRGQGKTRRGPSIANRVSIHERPPIIEEREEIGHWEGDLVVGKNQDGFIVTLVERHSRLTLAMVIETKKAPDVAQAVKNAIEEQPVSWVKTITFDNGTEFADHQTITQQIHAAIYFADPYSAYQRGSKEQVNGLIRRYLPKGTSFRYLNQEQLDASYLALRLPLLLSQLNTLRSRAEILTEL